MSKINTVHTITMKVSLPLLKQQKQALLSCIQDKHDAGDKPTVDLLDGLLNMLDMIHDQIDPPDAGPLPHVLACLANPKLSPEEKVNVIRQGLKEDTWAVMGCPEVHHFVRQHAKLVRQMRNTEDKPSIHDRMVATHAEAKLSIRKIDAIVAAKTGVSPSAATVARREAGLKAKKKHQPYDPVVREILDARKEERARAVKELIKEGVLNPPKKKEPK